MSTDAQQLSSDATDAGLPMHLGVNKVMEWLQSEESLKARWVGAKEKDMQFARVHTDTRTLKAGDLFVALKGERFDANAFLLQAKSAGAVAAICERGLQEANWSGIEVTDAGKALGVLAKAWRHELSLGVIAVTGSNGKTTVTQMLASILKAWQGERSLATVGNFNNAVGVPLTLLRMRPMHQCAVLELGMNHPGEIQALAHWVQPQVALVNNAQREHQEFMGSVRAVAIENAQVFKALGAGGVAVFPMDDDYSDLWSDMSQGHKVCRFGRSLEAEVVLLSSQWLDGVWRLVVRLMGQDTPFSLSLPGEHNVHNALASMACAVSLGVPVEKIQLGLAQFLAVQGRSHFKTVHLKTRDPLSGLDSEHSVGLVDDSYNANPDSVIAAIDLLARLESPRVLVLGDMGEVGEKGVMFHEEVGRYAAERGIEHVLCLGELTLHTAQAFGLSRTGQQRAAHFEEIESLINALCERLKGVQSVLVKGSRFMKMERVVQAVMSQNLVKEEISCS